MRGRDLDRHSKDPRPARIYEHSRTYRSPSPSRRSRRTYTPSSTEIKGYKDRHHISSYSRDRAGRRQSSEKDKDERRFSPLSRRHSPSKDRSHRTRKRRSRSPSSSKSPPRNRHTGSTKSSWSRQASRDRDSCWSSGSSTCSMSSEDGEMQSSRQLNESSRHHKCSRWVSHSMDFSTGHARSHELSMSPATMKYQARILGLSRQTLHSGARIFWSGPELRTCNANDVLDPVRRHFAWQCVDMNSKSSV